MKLIPSKILSLFLLFIPFLFLFFGTTFFSSAQDTDTIVPLKVDPEIVLQDIQLKINPNTGIPVWQEKFKGHLAGIDFGFNMFFNEDYSAYSTDFMKNDVLHSTSVSINIIQQSIGLQRARNTIGLVTGIGLHLYNYRLDKQTTIERDENSVVQPVIIDLDNIKKSNLAIMEIQLPLLAEFQIPVNHLENRIYLSTGIFGSMKLTSHTKVKYKLERYEKLKVVDHFSLRDIHYGIMIRTGYRYLNLFATYDLVPLFREDRGPELTPFTIGITLISF